MSEVLIQEFANLATTWGNAAVGEGKEAAFNKMVDWLLKNKSLGQTVARGGTTEAVFQRLMHRVFVAKGGQRIAYIAKGPHSKLYADRLARNFGKKVAKAPKSTLPLLNAVVLLGTILSMGCDGYEENAKMKGAMIEYEDYVLNYISKMAIAKSYHPWGKVASPMTFDEWYSYWKGD